MRTGFGCTLRKPRDAIPRLAKKGGPRHGKHLTSKRCEKLCRIRKDCLAFEHTSYKEPGWKHSRNDCWLFAVTNDKMSELPQETCPPEISKKGYTGKCEQSCGQATCSAIGQALCLPPSSARIKKKKKVAKKRCYESLEFVAVAEGPSIATLQYTSFSECTALCDADAACHSFAACPGDGNKCYMKTKKMDKTEPTRDTGRGCKTYFVNPKCTKLGNGIDAAAPKKPPYWAPEGAKCLKQPGACVDPAGKDQHNRVTKYVDDIHVAGTAKKMCVDCGGKRGRFVFVVLEKQKQYLTLCEVKVTAKWRAGTKSLDLKGLPTAQSTTAFNGDSARAVDGNTDQNFHSGSCTHTDKDQDAWWRVDLKKETLIHSVEVYNRADCCGNRLNGFQVKVGMSASWNQNENCKVSQAVDPSKSGSACLAWCRTEVGATGCEYTANGCFAHRAPVTKGNGKATLLQKRAGYGCWPFVKCDPPPPSTTGVPQLMGCYKDKGERDLPVREGSGSHEYCAKQCKGYAFYGRQWTQECWCGANFGKHGEATGCKCDAKNIGLFMNCVYKNPQYQGESHPLQLETVKLRLGNAESNAKNAYKGKQQQNAAYKSKEEWVTIDAPKFHAKEADTQLAQKLGAACVVDARQLCGGRDAVALRPKKLLKCLDWHGEKLSHMCALTVRWAISIGLGDAAARHAASHDSEEKQGKNRYAELIKQLPWHNDGVPFWKSWKFWAFVVSLMTVLGCLCGAVVVVIHRCTNLRHHGGGEGDVISDLNMAVKEVATTFREGLDEKMAAVTDLELQKMGGDDTAPAGS